MKFKVGDRVRVLENGGISPLRVGEIAEVTCVDDYGNIEDINNLKKVCTYSYQNEWYENLDEGSYVVTEESYKPADKKPIMSKLNTMMKKLLDKETQTLVKAGYINGDLQLTDTGREALNAIIFEANKEELVKSAEEVLAEEKD